MPSCGGIHLSQQVLGVHNELAGIYLCVAVMLILTGPGRFSLDRVVFGKRTTDREPLRF